MQCKLSDDTVDAKYCPEDDTRDLERQKLRDKYNIAKPANEDEESDSEDEDAFGTSGKKKDEGEEDPVARKFYMSLVSECWSVLCVFFLSLVSDLWPPSPRPFSHNHFSDPFTLWL